MSKQYRCENANTCVNKNVCHLAVPHEFEPGCLDGMNSTRTGCIKGSKCIPFVECSHDLSDDERAACDMARKVLPGPLA